MHCTWRCSTLCRDRYGCGLGFVYLDFFFHSFFGTPRSSSGWDLTGSGEHVLHSGLSEMSSTCSFPWVHGILQPSCSGGFCMLSLSSTSVSSLLFYEANPSTASLLDKHQLSSVGLGRAPSHSEACLCHFLTVFVCLYPLSHSWIRCVCVAYQVRETNLKDLCKLWILLLPSEAYWLSRKVRVAISPPDSVAIHLVQTARALSCLLQECDRPLSLCYGILWGRPTLTQALLIGCPPVSAVSPSEVFHSSMPIIKTSSSKPAFQWGLA